VDEVVEEGAVARSKADAPDIDGQVFLDNQTHLKPGDICALKSKKRTNTTSGRTRYKRKLLFCQFRISRLRRL
ncbi:hypothetical protein, partial [Reinekea blandensis]